MRPIKLNLFEIGSIFWMATSAIVLFLSLLGIFSIYSITLALLISTIIPLLMFRKKHLKIEKVSGSFKILGLVVLGVGILLSFLTVPTIFGGRDEGSYSNSAIMTVDDGHHSHDSKYLLHLRCYLSQGHQLMRLLSNPIHLAIRNRNVRIFLNYWLR